MCAHCGISAPVVGHQCSACGRAIGGANEGSMVGVGTVTPVPTSGDTDAATIGPVGIGRSTGSANDVTAFGDDVTLAPESGVTSFGASPTILPDSPADSTGVGESLPSNTTEEGSDTGPLKPGQAFGVRYHIIRLLGLGGMGVVYQAWDAELGVAVAIKVIRPEIMVDPSASAAVERRFKRELLLARQVTHKNVVRIHDLGEIGGIKYITMSYVDGTDLATLLKREGKLPVSDVMRIARSVVSGLVAAHSAGVVHRDLKPANIVIGADGDALIMDFGIARATGGPSAASRATANLLPANLRRSAARHSDATLLGRVVGTVEYMAPEQAKGQAVDQRVDIYALGLMLYDMLAGRRRAEQAPTALNELQLRMLHAPPPIKSIIPEIPAALDQLISRCVAPDPAARYQTTAELAGDLDRLDENGEPIPIKRVVGMRILAAVVMLAGVLLAGSWWYARSLIPPAQHEPVSVVIADLQNNTGDPTFDRVLEPTLKRALEGASFISAYDRAEISRTLGVRPPEKLDEATARGIAVKQGVGVVLSGSIDRQRSGYGISVKAVQAVTGNVIATASGKASNKDQLVGAVTKLVSAVRKGLGDDTSGSAREFAIALSATSLEAVRYHAAAMEAASVGNYDEALRGFSKAVAVDPKFGIAYQGMAAASLSLSKRQDAEKYISEALRHLDGMTPRESYSTRGLSYRLTGDYKGCVKEYSDLVAQYPADVLGHNNLAVCLSSLREMRKALDEMRQALAILPNRVVYHSNLALQADYATDFHTAEQEARTIQEPIAKAVRALAYAQLGQGQLLPAMETYRKLGAMGAQGPSGMASGLGDVALYEGRFSDAERILDEGAAADLTARDSDKAAAKLALLAYARLSRGQNRLAVAAANKALASSQAVTIRFAAARVFVEADEIAEARKLGASLAKEFQSEPQSYAKIVEGEIALKNKDPQQAIKLFSEADNLLDTWIGHFDLGRAYFEAGAINRSALTNADSEFDRCINRRGEALELFLDNQPTYSYLPLVYYYRGRVREELKTDGFAESYRTYLNIREKAGEDPRLPEIRRRAGR
jgi:tetratricopeptide (TPR) repeat protein/predicted Ser/Thr protein kinase